MQKLKQWLKDVPRARNISRKKALRYGYLIFTLLVALWTFVELGAFRSVFFKIAILKAKREIIELSDIAQRPQKYVELDSLDKQIENEYDSIIRDTANRRTLQFVFTLLTLAFAIVGGMCFSEGVRRLMKFFRLRATTKRLAKVQHRYHDLGLVVEFKGKEHGVAQTKKSDDCQVRQSLVEKYKKLYMHGYMRGFVEGHSTLSDVVESFLYQRHLRNLHDQANGSDHT